LIGLFALGAETGVDCDPALELSGPGECHHTPIFKMSTDYGDTWSGNGGNYYGQYHHIPANVWTHMVDNSFTDYYDPCADTSSALVDVWTYYNYDIKVDADGDPHLLVQVMGTDADGYGYYSNGDGTSTGSGWYHFTIDRNYLSNPGAVNTATGWNYSYVIDTRDTWPYSAPDGDSYIWGTLAQLAFSVDNPDIVWVVADLAVKGPQDEGTDADNTANGCDVNQDDSYREWSEDVFVYKSTDNGSTWWNPLNATETADDTDGVYSPEEQYPHAYQWGTDDQVYFMFQMPDWLFNEIGDPMGADHKNRVYAGYAELTSNTESEYPGGAGCSLLGDSNGDGFLNILDIVGTVNVILGQGTLANELCADFNEDGFLNILDIVATVNCILGTGNCGGLARLDSNVNAVLVGNRLDVDAVIGGLQFDGKLISELSGNDVIATANGKTLIYNAIEGVLSTTSFEFSSTPVNVIVASVDGADVELNVANQYLLMSSYPNPFNPETTISYELTQSSAVDLSVYNMLGQKVSTLVNENVDAGSYKSVWNGLDGNGAEMPSGIYMLRLTTENSSISEKVTLLR